MIELFVIIENKEDIPIIVGYSRIFISQIKLEDKFFQHKVAVYFNKLCIGYIKLTIKLCNDNSLNGFDEFFLSISKDNNSIWNNFFKNVYELNETELNAFNVNCKCSLLGNIYI